MNSQEFIDILQQPQLINSKQTDDLKTVIDAFPYFQSARAMYLNGLKNKDSFKYNQALKTTATYTTDRSILFDFITSEVFNQNEISQLIKQNSTFINDLEIKVEDISINKSVVIDTALKSEIEALKNTLEPDFFQPKIETKLIANFTLDTSEAIEEDSAESKTFTNKEAETILNLGKPLQFDKTETHSFNEWLTLSRFKPINRLKDNTNEDTIQQKNIKQEVSKSNLDKAKKFELIDQFIARNPKLGTTKSIGKTNNIAKAQMIQPDVLMTETLARIYVEQKNYKKAVQSYKILSLKYPEKSGFFADQIKAVKQLQEQNKQK